MALDTRNRRASAIAVGLPFRAWLAPDGSLGIKADREHLVYLYRLTADPSSGLQPVIGGGSWPRQQPRVRRKIKSPQAPVIDEDEEALAVLLIMLGATE